MRTKEIDANNNIFNENTNIADLKGELLDKLRTVRSLTGKEIKMLLNYFIDNE